MAPKIDTTSGATVFFAFVAALFCFVGFSTLGWTIMSITDNSDDSTGEINVYIGLRRMCTEVSYTTIATGSEINDKQCWETNCEGLDNQDCDHLTNAKIGGAVATATAALLIILAIVLALVDRMAWRTAALVTYVINIALALAFAVAAFIAIAEWEKLIEAAKEPGVNVDVGYSWVLMLIAGILACFSVVGSIMGFMAAKKTTGVATVEMKGEVIVKA